MAFPPGLEISTYVIPYVICRPASGWPWKPGSVVGRTKLRRFLGGEGLRAVEETGGAVFTPTLPAQRTVEWATAEESDLEPLRQTPQQRALLEALAGHERGRPVEAF
jgi:hypothetical protein